MMTKVAILLVCLIVVLEAAPNREAEKQEIENDFKVGIQILRDSLKFAEDELTWRCYQECWGAVDQPMRCREVCRSVPAIQYEDTSSFKRNLANLAYWQAVRLAPGFDETTVLANKGEMEMIRIAKYLSEN